MQGQDKRREERGRGVKKEEEEGEERSIDIILGERK